MSKVAFSSEKYQAVIRMVNAGIAAGVSNRNLRGYVLGKFKAGPDGNRGHLDGVEMTKNGLSTYIANVKEANGLNDYNSTDSVVTGVVKRDSNVVSIVKIENGIVVQAKYYTDASYLDVDTTGLDIVKGYQIVGQKPYVVASTALTLDEGQELEI